MATYRAPGRINLIGEHTDYNHGWVMPSAIALETQVEITPRSDGEIRIASRQFPGPGRWSDSLHGVATLLARAAGRRLRGAEIVIDSQVPVGAGLSSSAAVEVATATALAKENGLSLDATALAQLCQQASHEFGGTRCGIMDLYIAAHGRAGEFCLLDTQSLEACWLARPQAMALVACDSGVRHQHASGAYNHRREECEAAARALGIASLREATPAMLSGTAHRLDPLLLRRARHVVSENARVHAAAAAFAHEDFPALGEILDASHRSLRDDFEVSCPELDSLAARCRAFAGVYGARMMGGGFGGCVLALVAPEQAQSLVAAFTPAWQV